MKTSTLSILAILLLAACNSQASTAPTLHIAVSPAAQPVSQAIAACAPINSGMGLSIEMRSPSIVDMADVDLLIRLGKPDKNSVFAAQVAWEKIVLIVNSENDLDLTRDMAASLFHGQVPNWSELGGGDIAVTLWAGSENDEARQAFESSMLHSSVSGGTHIAANPDIALGAVANDAGAIAILPAAWADETVRHIDLDLQIPVIAVAASEPSGVIRDLLACLQSPIGQAAISEQYVPFQQ